MTGSNLESNGTKISFSLGNVVSVSMASAPFRSIRKGKYKISTFFDLSSLTLEAPRIVSLLTTIHCRFFSTVDGPKESAEIFDNKSEIGFSVKIAVVACTSRAIKFTNKIEKGKARTSLCRWVNVQS
uniref:Uncharacterized protein n=1 Tax=Romanomermis culicivorax TaxID=13658 RepID=A0A915IR51_ROMCU